MYPATLADLEAAVARDHAYIDYPLRPWVPEQRLPSGEPVLDVAIVGAGLNGLAIGYLLLRERVTNIRLFDRAPAGREGPWTTYARMEILRTPKSFVGPDAGLTHLGFPAWYRARHGEAAWRALDKATRREWQDYLDWFREVAGLPVRNESELSAILPLQGRDLLALDFRSPGGVERVYARKVVLATGALGAGGPRIPAMVAKALPADRYAHSSDEIDFASLRGCRIGVLGAGASAFDNAATALEAGAASVDLFARRDSIEQINIKQSLEFVGFLRHFGDMDDARRWRVMRRLARYSVPPPPETLKRCSRFPNLKVHTRAPWLSVAQEGGRIAVNTPQGSHRFDFVILGTGFAVDIVRRPELAGFAERIALWRDVYTPEPASADPALGQDPYLGPAFEYREKVPGSAPFLRHIHDFGIGSVQSMGPVCVGLNGMKFGPARLVTGLTRALFLEDAARHEAAMEAFERGLASTADPTTI